MNKSAFFLRWFMLAGFVSNIADSHVADLPGWKVLLHILGSLASLYCYELFKEERKDKP